MSHYIETNTSRKFELLQTQTHFGHSSRFAKRRNSRQDAREVYGWHGAHWGLASNAVILLWQVNQDQYANTMRRQRLHWSTSLAFSTVFSTHGEVRCARVTVNNVLLLCQHISQMPVTDVSWCSWWRWCHALLSWYNVFNTKVLKNVIHGWARPLFNPWWAAQY